MQHFAHDAIGDSQGIVRAADSPDQHAIRVIHVYYIGPPGRDVPLSAAVDGVAGRGFEEWRVSGNELFAPALTADHAEDARAQNGRNRDQQ